MLYIMFQAEPGIQAPDLNDPANLINRENIPDNVPLYTLGWTLVGIHSSQTLLSIPICISNSYIQSHKTFHFPNARHFSFGIQTNSWQNGRI